MRGFDRGNRLQRWARFALKCGLLVTDAKLWSSINDQLRDRADDMGDVAKRTYDETTDRISHAQAALRGESRWPSHAINFLGGVGLGVGLGILLAPASGEQTRSAIRDKVVDLKSRAAEMASSGMSRGRKMNPTISVREG
jgi:YtxH-like protein